MSFGDSFDTKVLRWSGLAVIAFLAAAFALNSHPVNSRAGLDHPATYASRVIQQPRTVVR